MKRLFFIVLALFLLSGCSFSLFGEGSTEDKIEVGLYNSLKSTAVAYKELSSYIKDTQWQYTDEQRASIEDAAKKYRYAYHAALDAWDTYKAYGSGEMDAFVFTATDAIKSFRELYNLVKGDES
jgi:hypothetical protein